MLSMAGMAARAQQDTPSLLRSRMMRLRPPRRAPYGIGEKLVYDLAVGGAKVGTGSMTHRRQRNDQRSRDVHSVFEIKGGFLFFKVNDRLESWFEPATATSHRFYQLLNEGSYHKDRYFEIYPERAMLHQRGFEREAKRSRAARRRVVLLFRSHGAARRSARRTPSPATFGRTRIRSS